MNIFCAKHIFKILKFWGQFKNISTKSMQKCVVNTNFIHFNLCYCFNHQHWNLLHFWEGMVHIWYGKGCLNKEKYFQCFKHAKNFLKLYQFLSYFDYWNFTIEETFSPKFFDNSTYCAPFHNFQNFIIIVLSIVHTP